MLISNHHMLRPLASATAHAGIERHQHGSWATTLFSPTAAQSSGSNSIFLTASVARIALIYGYSSPVAPHTVVRQAAIANPW